MVIGFGVANALLLLQGRAHSGINMLLPTAKHLKSFGRVVIGADAAGAWLTRCSTVGNAPNSMFDCELTTGASLLLPRNMVSERQEADSTSVSDGHDAAPQAALPRGAVLSDA